MSENSEKKKKIWKQDNKGKSVWSAKVWKSVSNIRNFQGWWGETFNKVKIKQC